MPVCGRHLWYNYRKYNFTRLLVAYNVSSRILHHISQFVSVRRHQF